MFGTIKLSSFNQEIKMDPLSKYHSLKGQIFSPIIMFKVMLGITDSMHLMILKA